MERIDIKPVTEAFTGSEQAINTMKIERSFIENENQGKIDWAANAASMYAVVNKDAKNPYGEYRGYRIAPGVGSPVHLIATNSSLTNNTANFAKNHFYVTKRKDTEPHSASVMNDPGLDEQHVDFDKFFDGESIEQEDIVVFFNLGMHHVPHTG
jgi:primary-amine oxidase